MSIKEKTLNYKDILNKLNMSQLSEICRRYKFTGYSKLKKSQLVEMISENMFQRDFFQKVIISMNYMDVELLKNFHNPNYVINDAECINLAKNSFALIDTKNLSVSIAEDIVNYFEEIFTAEFEEKYNYFRSIITYCRALTELWGIVPMDKMIEIFNKQNGSNITAEDVTYAVDCSYYSTNCFYYYENKTDEIINESLLVNTDDIDKLRARQKDKPFYIPDKMQLIRYTDDFYFDKNIFCYDMEKFLENQLHLEHSVAKNLTDELNIMAKMDCSLDDIFGYLEFQGIEINTESLVNKFLQKYIAIQNNSRMWQNRGFTSNELKNIKSAGGDISKIAVTHKKVGRNDPCPCGSGKKYKKCCGSIK